jgi:hypothetical protein
MKSDKEAKQLAHDEYFRGEEQGMWRIVQAMRWQTRENIRQRLNEEFEKRGGKR